MPGGKINFRIPGIPTIIFNNKNSTLKWVRGCAVWIAFKIEMCSWFCSDHPSKKEVALERILVVSPIMVSVARTSCVRAAVCERSPASCVLCCGFVCRWPVCQSGADHEQRCSCQTLQHTATHYTTLQQTATHCNTLQYTATRCNARNTLHPAPTAVGQKGSASPS